MHVTLTSSDDPHAGWICHISLQKEYSLYSKVVDGPFGQWGHDDPPMETPFATVHDKKELEQMIRRAQFATLNPGDDVSKYISGDINGLTACVEFSPNVIKLEIIDHGLPALSFYDLPGIINVTENSEDRWLVKCVKTLVKRYVEKANSIVLLACSLETDMQNSSASKLITKIHGAEKRTVGCLTKPDRMPGDHDIEGLFKLLGKGSFQVEHGY